MQREYLQRVSWKLIYLVRNDAWFFDMLELSSIFVYRVTWIRVTGGDQMNKLQEKSDSSKIPKNV